MFKLVAEKYGDYLSPFLRGAYLNRKQVLQEYISDCLSIEKYLSELAPAALFRERVVNVLILIT